MEDPKFINLVGYSEMYEWNEVPLKNIFGRFVQFSEQSPDRIEYYDGTRPLIGISTIQSTVTSDNPPEWRGAYMCSEVGDRFLKEEHIAVGIKQYDQHLELAYISTQPYNYYNTIPNKSWNQEQKYIKRSNRREWVRVNLLGKAIVEDDGTCKPGDYCMPAIKNLNIEKGVATQWVPEVSKYKFYVLRRISDNTIEILNSPNLFE